MQRKRLAGPAYLAGSATNVWNNGSGGVLIDFIRHIRIANEDPSIDYTYSLWLGASGASTGGTALAKGETCPAGDHVDLYFPGLKMLSTDFLVGAASTANKLVITVMGEQDVA